ncbi:MAG: hypothetical protein K0S56_927 [Microvirga sp.]|jgi:hypothetical protein|nr:hypothetical protein [Microvirga sp.]
MSDIKSIVVRVGGEGGALLRLNGRKAWALDALHKAGALGCTPIERPAPRWSDYVMHLRRAGLDIETVDEPHGGTYAGHHGRYVLRSPVEVIAEVRA